MNCFIILLLLCCCGNSNKTCCENSCDCKRDIKDKKDDCFEKRSRREECREDRRENATPWQDFPNYGRAETCGCEES